jgi:hypothetical protein
VQVVTPATGIAVGPKAPGYFTYYDPRYNPYGPEPIQRIAAGKTSTFLATPYSIYGKPSQPAVEWSVEKHPDTPQGWWDEIARHISVSSKGVVSVSKYINKAYADETVFFYVRATLNDGSGKSAVYKVVPVNQDTSMKAGQVYWIDKKNKIACFTMSYKNPYTPYSAWNDDLSPHIDFRVTSSSNSVVQPWYIYNFGSGSATRYVIVYLKVTGTGTFSITVKSNSTGTSCNTGLYRL